MKKTLINNGRINIRFDKHINSIIIEHTDDNGKLQWHPMSLPPCRNCIDIIDHENRLKNGSYTHNFDGIVIVSTSIGRSIYYNGTLMAYKEF